MVKLCVPYEIGLELKKLNFNDECLMVSNGLNTFDAYQMDIRFDNKIACKNSDFYNSAYSDFITLPTWDQCLEWLREVKYIHLNPKKLSNGYCWEMTTGSLTQFYPFTNDYNEGREAVILKAIDLLKEDK